MQSKVKPSHSHDGGRSPSNSNKNYLSHHHERLYSYSKE
jgi:hypothetical protein